MSNIRKKSDYGRDDVVRALKEVGLEKGAIAFSHSNLSFFGRPEGGSSEDVYSRLILQPILEALGEEGAFVVPTFTYSFPYNQPYDPDDTPSTCGLLTEMVRNSAGAYRSDDPIFSVAAIGGKAREMTEDVSIECFGLDSFWDRFYRADGVLLGLNFGATATFFHYIERQMNVTYRYNKLFPGVFIKNGVKSKRSAIYFCHDMANENTVCNWRGIVELAIEKKIVRYANVGRGYISLVRAADIYNLIVDAVKGNPFFLTAARTLPSPPALVQPSRIQPPRLSENAGMMEMINSLWKLPRDLVSDGYDAALQALAAQVPMTIHEYPTGEDCWSWMVPEKWCCTEAYLETMAGERIFSYEDHILHVASYSQPFDGVVSREDLFEHLSTDPQRVDAIPYAYLFYQRDWGLCCSQNTKDSLTDDEYRVVIKSEFSFGTLKVGEIVVPGESEECIVLCAHLDHPGQANDGLSGVVVGLDVMRELMKREDLRYTYRMIIVPETVGSAAYLSHNEHLIPMMKGGLFLETFGLSYPHALQLSHQGNSDFDVICQMALHENDPDGWTGAFERVVGNDETQFNAPGVGVPMLSLSRVEKSWMDGLLYPEYHTHRDSMDVVSQEKIQDSKDLVLTTIDYFEADRIPKSKYRGIVFLSRFGVDYNFYQDPNTALAILDIMYYINGKYTISQIAEKCKISFKLTHSIIKDFYERGIVEYIDSPES